MATCGARSHVLELPVRASVDSTIDRRDPAVASAFHLFDRAWGRVFEADTRLSEAAGTALVPYLRSGRFAAVLSPQAFENYSPARRSPVPPELLERDALPLEAYQPPTYPPIAWSAGVAGDVRLRLRVSPEGEVTGVQVLKSIPLLNDAAVKAARAWKFKPQSLAAENVEVTLRFQKRCGG